MKSKYHKLIAGQPTPEKKWEISIFGGLPPTEICKLVRSVSGVRTSRHPKDWKDEQTAILKLRFADLLFPALWKDDPEPFEELLKEMAKFRREIRAGKVASLPKKVETARLLDTAILNLEHVGKLDSIKSVLEWLDQNGVEFSDESHVRRRMKQLGVKLSKKRADK